VFLVRAVSVNDDDDDRSRESLDIIDGDLLGPASATGVAIAIAVLVELEAAVAVFAGTESVGFVDLGRVGQLAVGLPGVGVRVLMGEGWSYGGSGTYRERASSAEYLRITSPFSSWYSRRDTRMMSPLLIQIFFRSLPRIKPRRLTPSKHCSLAR
jgi:hypothetical protein